MTISNMDVAYKDGLQKAAEIFHEHGDFILNVIRFQSKNENIVNDLFQNFFLSIAASPPPKDVKNIRNYLYKAIFNDIVDSSRRLQTYQGRIRRLADGYDYITVTNRPERALIETEEAGKMLDLIREKLPKSQAQAITLRFMQGNNIGEIAQKMSVDTRSVSRYISVGLSKIRALLHEQEIVNE